MAKRKITTRKSGIFSYPMAGQEPAALQEARHNAEPLRITYQLLAAFCHENPGVDSEKGRSLAYAKLLLSNSPKKLTPSKQCSKEAATQANAVESVLHFSVFCKSKPEYATLFEVEDDKTPVITMKTNLYLLWDAVYGWWRFRCSFTTGNLDNGWYRHAARLLARFQEDRLLGQQSWWRQQPDDSRDSPDSAPPPKRAKKNKPVVESSQLTTQLTPPSTPTRTLQPTSELAPEPAPEPAPERALSPTLVYEEVKAQEWSPPGGWPTHSVQLARYLGFIPNFVKFARELEQASIAKGRGGGISTAQTRRWLLKNPEYIPEDLRNVEWQVDHVIPSALGGPSWVFNYVLMPTEVNQHFKDMLNKEKRRYVGQSVFTAAKSFARWFKARAHVQVQCGRYDPLLDFFQSGR